MPVSLLCLARPWHSHSSQAPAGNGQAHPGLSGLGDASRPDPLLCRLWQNGDHLCNRFHLGPLANRKTVERLFPVRACQRHAKAEDCHGSNCRSVRACPQGSQRTISGTGKPELKHLTRAYWGKSWKYIRQ